MEILREAAGDGRLTAEELDERVEAALTARTGSELAVLTADLPAPRVDPGAQPKDLVTINQRFGSVERTGRWVVPRRMDIRLTAGNVKLDFTEALIQRASLHIDQAPPADPQPAPPPRRLRLRPGPARGARPRVKPAL